VRKIFLLIIALLACAPAANAAAQPRSGIFFYPWYGTPALDGGWVHWHQAGRTPPVDIASSFYPARGIYSSSDTLLLGVQLDEIKAAGVEQLIVSWWGRGSAEDARLPAVAAAARARGLSVAAHIEPYDGRTVASVENDVAYLRRFDVADIYLYRPFELPVHEWAALNERVEGVRLWAETALAGRAAAARFDGLYTYDILIHDASKLDRICAQARKVRLLCAPSVGPGYDARRAGLDARVKPRRNGLTYDTMWRAAVRSRPDAVTITSYNEWHEGTQIEPARVRNGYASYDGAWGRKGTRAERAYLDRTAYWTKTLASALKTSAS
jgi:glycoprotein endo-alpha-1,2-mannosidase